MTQLLMVKLINSEVRVFIRVSGKTQLRSLFTQSNTGSKTPSPYNTPGKILLTAARGGFARSEENKGQT